MERYNEVSVQYIWIEKDTKDRLAFDDTSNLEVVMDISMYHIRVVSCTEWGNNIYSNPAQASTPFAQTQQ